MMLKRAEILMTQKLAKLRRIFSMQEGLQMTTIKVSLYPITSVGTSIPVSHTDTVRVSPYRTSKGSVNYPKTQNYRLSPAPSAPSSIKTSAAKPYSIKATPMSTRSYYYTSRNFGSGNVLRIMIHSIEFYTDEKDKLESFKPKVSKNKTKYDKFLVKQASKPTPAVRNNFTLSRKQNAQSSSNISSKMISTLEARAAELLRDDPRFKTENSTENNGSYLI